MGNKNSGPRKGWVAPDTAPPTSIELGRFYAKVDTEHVGQGCWLWTGALNNDGYGHFWFADRTWRAHHLPFIWRGEKLPTWPMITDHLCKVRNCVNPAHLQVAHQHENCVMLAKDSSPFRRNKMKTACPVGHPYSPENTAWPVRGDRRAGRLCLTCYPTAWRWAQIPRDPPPGARKFRRAA